METDKEYYEYRYGIVDEGPIVDEEDLEEVEELPEED